MSAPEALPSLSELQAWPTEHFTTIADWCDAEADRWERSFTTTHQLVDNADWEGRAHDAALRRMELDLSKARGGGEELRAAAKILRSTGENEQFAKSAALRVVTEAQAAQYVVAEDLSVTDTIAYATWEQATARRAMAREFAADIRAEAASLMRIDHDIAARLPAISAALHNIRFTETPLYTTGRSADPEHHRVHLVDHTWKQAPPKGPGDLTGADGGAGGPYDPNPNHSGRNNLGHYTKGNTGSADAAAAAEKALRDREDKTGIPLIRQQIRVAMTDPATGQILVDKDGTGRPLYRYYDALEPLPGRPGMYRGIEVKSGGADWTRTQRLFDRTVSPDMPARGTLNGQPVEVIDAEKIHAPAFVPPTPASVGADGGAGGAAAGTPAGGSPAPIISPPPALPPSLDHPGTAPSIPPLDHPAPVTPPPTTSELPLLPPGAAIPPEGFDLLPPEATQLPIATEPPAGPPITLHAPTISAPTPEQLRQAGEVGAGTLGVGTVLALLATLLSPT